MQMLSRPSIWRARRAQQDLSATEFLADLPMLLIVGSLDAASRSDVLAYARGLADSQVIAKDACYVGATKIDGRWVYEVHEGGTGRSVVEWISKQLTADSRARVNLPLTGDRVASIGSTAGEFVTIIHPPNAERFQTASSGAQAMELGGRVQSLYGSAVAFRNAAVAIFALSSFAFLVSGATLFLRSNAIDVGRYAGKFAASNPGLRTDMANLPSFQLDLAAKNLKASAGYLSYLKFESGKWTWAQATASNNGNSTTGSRNE